MAREAPWPGAGWAELGAGPALAAAGKEEGQGAKEGAALPVGPEESLPGKLGAPFSQEKDVREEEVEEEGEEGEEEEEIEAGDNIPQCDGADTCSSLSEYDTEDEARRGRGRG